VRPRRPRRGIRLTGAAAVRTPRRSPPVTCFGMAVRRKPQREPLVLSGLCTSAVRQRAPVGPRACEASGLVGASARARLGQSVAPHQGGGIRGFRYLCPTLICPKSVCCFGIAAASAPRPRSISVPRRSRHSERSMVLPHGVPAIKWLDCCQYGCGQPRRGGSGCFLSPGLSVRPSRPEQC
jgi:hypothetical protein